MKTYKLLAAGLAVASLMSASVASAQVATTTATTTQGTGTATQGADLAVSIGGTGITLSAANSNVPIAVMGLPFSIGAGAGGTCTLQSSGTTLGTIGTSGTVNFNNSVVVPAGSSVTLPVVCTGSNPGTFPVTLITSTIPAIVQGTSRSITPRGIGGGADNDTTAVGTLTINSSGNVGGITGTTGGSTGSTGSTGTTGSTGGAVLGTSTGTPNIPNTGSGDAAINLIVMALAALVAVGGGLALRKTRLI